MLKSRRALAALAVLWIWQGGCEKRDRAVPPAPPSLPPLAAGKAPAEPSKKALPPQMPSNHMPVLQGAMPVPQAGAETATVLASGTIKIADAVKDKVKMGAVLFLSGRSVGQGGAPGMVLLAKKLMVTSSEIAFQLTSDDLMGMGGAPTGPVLLQGRVDQDEDASTKQPGDVEGQLGPLTLPARSLTVVLETVRKEGSGPPADSTFGHGAMPPEHGSLPPGHVPIPSAQGELPPGHIPVPVAKPTQPADGKALPKATGAKPAGHP